MNSVNIFTCKLIIFSLRQSARNSFRCSTISLSCHSRKRFQVRHYLMDPAWVNEVLSGLASGFRIGWMLHFRQNIRLKITKLIFFSSGLNFLLPVHCLSSLVRVHVHVSWECIFVDSGDAAHSRLQGKLLSTLLPVKAFTHFFKASLFISFPEQNICYRLNSASKLFTVCLSALCPSTLPANLFVYVFGTKCSEL